MYAVYFIFGGEDVIYKINLAYLSVCSEDAIVVEKRLSSPNYPYKYPSNANCSWIIKSPLEHHEIVLKIKDLDVEPQAVCRFDYIQIGTGSVPGQNIIVNRLCGREKPGPIKSDSGALWLRFVSDSKKSYKGFRATWKAKKIRQAFPNPEREKNGRKFSSLVINVMCISWLLELGLELGG